MHIYFILHCIANTVQLKCNLMPTRISHAVFLLIARTNLCMCPHTVWPENLTGIKFDEIASKLHNKNMMDFKFNKMPGKKAHSIRKI